MQITKNGTMSSRQMNKLESKVTMRHTPPLTAGMLESGEEQENCSTQTEKKKKPGKRQLD